MWKCVMDLPYIHRRSRFDYRRVGQSNPDKLLSSTLIYFYIYDIVYDIQVENTVD